MTEDDKPGGAGVALQRVLTLRYLVVFGLAYLAPTVVFNYYGIKNVGSRGDLFERSAVTARRARCSEKRPLPHLARRTCCLSGSRPPTSTTATCSMGSRRSPR